MARLTNEEGRLPPEPPFPRNGRLRFRPLARTPSCGGGLDGTQESYVEAILRASQALQDTVLAYLERAQDASQAEA